MSPVEITVSRAINSNTHLLSHVVNKAPSPNKLSYQDMIRGNYDSKPVNERYGAISIEVSSSTVDGVKSKNESSEHQIQPHELEIIALGSNPVGQSEKKFHLVI
jgi:hypothetical protein